MNKRSFVRKLATGLLAGPYLFPQLDKLVTMIGDRTDYEVASDETFWSYIRSGYRLKPDYINLENGYYCMIPQETLENHIHHIREVNYQASHYMRTVQRDNKLFVREKLAELAGCSREELVVTRNTTESLDLIIQGMHWQPGDEAVMAEQDYFAMLAQFRLQSERHGIVNRIISIPNHPVSDEEIVELYANAINSKTKLLMVCHMVNITGQILPVRKICDMAHKLGVEVMVDGAHAFGHVDFKMSEMDCDYYGTSLHKWLSVPLGAGMLYVKKEKIKKVWPLFAHYGFEQDEIERINHLGTHPVHTELAILNALDYHDRIGPARKEARLRYLQRYWTDQVRDWEHIIINTPTEPHRSCGIGNVGIKNMKPKEMADRLLKEHRIWTVAIDGHGVHGCRITPNIYTTTKELDKFVAALKSMKV